MKELQQIKRECFSAMRDMLDEYFDRYEDTVRSDYVDDDDVDDDDEDDE